MIFPLGQVWDVFFMVDFFLGKFFMLPTMLNLAVPRTLFQRGGGGKFNQEKSFPVFHMGMDIIPVRAKQLS